MQDSRAIYRNVTSSQTNSSFSSPMVAIDFPPGTVQSLPSSCSLYCSYMALWSFQLSVHGINRMSTTMKSTVTSNLITNSTWTNTCRIRQNIGQTFRQRSASHHMIASTKTLKIPTTLLSKRNRRVGRQILTIHFIENLNFIPVREKSLEQKETHQMLDFIRLTRDQEAPSTSIGES